MANQTSNVVMEVQPREETGKNACRRLRASGRIPGNVYGLDRDPFKVSVNPRRITELLHLGSGVNTIFNLTLVGEERSREAMIKELQRDPVTDEPIHIDFIRVDPKRKIHVSVPVQLEGLPEGVKNEGGIIDFVLRNVEMECLPTEIPETLSVDVSGLHINQNVTVGDIDLPAGLTMVEDAGRIVAVVVAPKVEEEPAAEEEVEEEAEAEPEVAKKGKEPEAPAEGGDKES